MKFLLLAFIAIATAAFGATPADTTVAFYHGAPDRAGNYDVPGLNWRTAGAVHPDVAFDGRAEGHIYAQPLHWRPPGADRGLIIAATESDLVFALDATTGRVVWRTSVGRPVPRRALPCGNIDPLGVTGTPVIDAAHGTVYLDAMSGDQGSPRHLVYGLKLSDGSILPGFPLDVTAALAARGIAFESAVQNQRGALSLLDGRVFIPFGGHYGDCGDYHGAIVAVGVDRAQVLGAWITRALKGGIWAPAGMSAADGSLYFATGNTDGARDWQDGEAVFRIAPDLARPAIPRDAFTPSNWKRLDESDLDLGGVAPLPLTLPGNAKRLLLAMGKDGNAYLLDRMVLGGVGGALAVSRAARGVIITSPAAWPARDAMMVAYEARGAACSGGGYVAGIAALAVTADPGRQLRPVWCAPMDGRGAPIVTSDNGSEPIVWAVGAEGDNRLHGFRGDTGQVVYAQAGQGMAGLRHFATILVAAGRLYVAGDGQIFAFALP